MTNDVNQRPRPARPRAPEVRLLPPEPDDPWPDDEPELDGAPERRDDDDEPEQDGDGHELRGEVEDHLSADGRVQLWLEYAESDRAVRVRQDRLRHPESFPDHRTREAIVRPPPKQPRRPLPSYGAGSPEKQHQPDAHALTLKEPEETTMTPSEPQFSPEPMTNDDAPDFEPGAGCVDRRDDEVGADEFDWRVHGPIDDDGHDDGRYDDGRDDDDWGDYRWDRYDGYESLHQRHAPHDWPIFDQPTEPSTDDEARDEIDAAEREAEAAEPDAFRWFRQDADESA